MWVPGGGTHVLGTSARVGASGPTPSGLRHDLVAGRAGIGQGREVCDRPTPRTVVHALAYSLTIFLALFCQTV